MRAGEEVSNNAIEVYIHRLRKKIEKGPIRIATVRGLGHRLGKNSGLAAFTQSALTMKLISRQRLFNKR